MLKACFLVGPQNAAQAGLKAISMAPVGLRRQKPRCLDNWRVDGGESVYILIWHQAYPALAIVPIDLSTPQAQGPA